MVRRWQALSLEWVHHSSRSSPMERPIPERTSTLKASEMKSNYKPEVLEEVVNFLFFGTSAADFLMAVSRHRLTLTKAFSDQIYEECKYQWLGSGSFILNNYKSLKVDVLSHFCT